MLKYSADCVKNLRFISISKLILDFDEIWHRDLISSRQITKYRHGDQMSSCQVIYEPQNVTPLSPRLMRLSTLVYKLTIQMGKSLSYLVEYFSDFLR